MRKKDLDRELGYKTKREEYDRISYERNLSRRIIKPLARVPRRTSLIKPARKVNF